MKRFSLWFAVAFVLFSFSGGFAKPTQEQLDSLEALFPPVIPSNDYIYYDSVETVGGEPYWNATNYWIAEKFTPEGAAFSLKVIYYQVDNSQTNYVDGCSVYVANSKNNAPDSILFSIFIPAPLSSRLRSIEIKDSSGQPDSLSFGEGQDFWILLGRVPGGPHPDSADTGDGWWAFEGRTQYLGRSWARFEGDTAWSQRSEFNWVLRAGGDYAAAPDPVINEVMFSPDPLSPDPSRGHEWVELYNPGPQLNATGWRVENGGGPSQITGVAAKFFPLPDFQFSANAYMVVHFTSGTNDLDLSNGRGDIYTGNIGEFFGDMIDACGFRFGPSVPYADIVAWNLKNLSKDPNAGGQTFIEGAGNFNSLNKVGRVQPAGAIGPLLTATKGISIGRNRFGSNPPSSPNGINLNLLGGPNAAGPTMGRQNILPMVIDTSSRDNSAVLNAERTIMLYFAADNGAGADAQERWCYDLLNEVERSIPASPQNVNVVVWVDSRRAYPINNPSDTGAVFRGVLRQDTTDIVRNLERLQELTSGSAASLEGFITWAKANFSADKYVLALKGDGAGWQGLCGDAESSDRLEMGELKSALQTGLGTDTLELLIFDAPLMSQLEVAVQVQSFARAMVASPEMTGPADFDYRRLVSNMEGGALAAETPDSVAKNVVGTILGPRRTVGDLYWTWVALRLDSDSLGRLLDTLEVLAANLQAGVEDRCQVGTASNNFQLFIRNQLKISDHYGGQAQGMADFVDLKSFCFTLGYFSNPHVSCADSNRHGARGVDSLLRTVEGVALPPSPVLLAQSLLEGNGRHYANSGISIYFPSSRQNFPPIQAAQKLAPAPAVFRDSSEHSFDNPGLAVEGGIFSTLRVYAADSTACYPNDGTPCPRDSSDTLVQIYPYPPAPDFDFVQNYSWDEFLIRYYKPVADAGVASGAANIGAPFPLNGSGSSDADDEPGDLQFFWDMDETSDDDLVNCTDYASEDMDKDCSDDEDDDRDTSEVTAGAIFQSPGLTTVTLNVWDGYDSDSSIHSGRRYQTAKSTVGVLVNSPDAWVVALDNTLPTDFYETWVDRIPGVFPNRTRLFTCSERDNQSLVNQIASQGEEPIFWQTGRVGSCLFPPASLNVLTTRLVDSVKPRGVWVFAPKLGADPDYQTGNLRSFFRNHFGLDTILSAQSSTMLLPSNPALPVFQGWDTIFPIQLKTAPDTLAADLAPLASRCTTEVRFPLLKDQLGNVVAIAAIEDLGGVKRGRILSSFGLEHIRLDGLSDTLKLDVLLANLHQWMFEPDEGIAGGPCCPADSLGDLTGNDTLTASDAVLMSNCVFLGSGIGTVDGTCDLCFTDVDCNGVLTASDVVLESNRVFLGLTAPPWCGP